jgi:hypothetical protein
MALVGQKAIANSIPNNNAPQLPFPVNLFPSPLYPNPFNFNLWLKSINNPIPINMGAKNISP